MKLIFFFLLSTRFFLFGAEWTAYYEKTLEAKNPRTTLVQALKSWEAERRKPGFALDLGCGTGRDSLFLLKKGWHVLAIDKQEEALCILSNRTPQESFHLLCLEQQEFEKLCFPDQVDLINASYSLAWCPPLQFPELWRKIVCQLSLGGRFAGQFFGDRDAWAIYPHRTHHSYQQVWDLFRTHFEIEYFFIEEGGKPLRDG